MTANTAARTTEEALKEYASRLVAFHAYKQHSPLHVAEAFERVLTIHTTARDAENVRLNARVAELEGALRPFAHAGSTWTAEAGFTIANLRRARSVLTKEGTP